MLYVARSIQIQYFREGQYFSSDNAEYSMLFCFLQYAFLGTSICKQVIHPYQIKIEMEKHYIYLYEDLCKKIIRQLEKSLQSNYISREYLESKGKRRLMEQHSLQLTKFSCINLLNRCQRQQIIICQFSTIPQNNL